MANLTSTNPIVCNATGTLVTGNGEIKAVIFANTSTDADHTLILIDGADSADSTKKIIQLELTAETKTICFTPSSPITFRKNLICQTIDGGEALIFV